MGFQQDFQKLFAHKIETQDPCTFSVLGSAGTGKLQMAKNCAVAFRRAALCHGHIVVIDGADLDVNNPASLAPLSQMRGFVIIDEIYNAPHSGAREALTQNIFDAARRNASSLVFTGTPDDMHQWCDANPDFAQRLQNTPVFDMNDAEASVDIADRILQQHHKHSSEKKQQWLEAHYHSKAVKMITVRENTVLDNIPRLRMR